MWTLALSSIRSHRGRFLGVFVAVFFAALLTTGLGTLLESGLRGGVQPDRYRGADVVVGAPQSLPVSGDVAEPFTERALLPESTQARVASVPGVARAVADTTVPLTTAENRPVEAHGWSAAQLTPYTLTAGRQPERAAEVVLDASFGLRPGAAVTLASGGTPTDYTVVGTVSAAAAPGADPDRPGTVFLSADRMAALWPHPGQVAAVGVLATPGADLDRLVADLAVAVPGAALYTGDRRGDAESLASSGARSELTVLSASFSGVALLIALFVLASTLSLSMAQRSREFALLRAVGTTPGQILRLVAQEILVVAGVAAVAGVLPGLWLARALAGQFASAGVIPTDFRLAFSPLPALAAVLLSMATALAAAAVAARRPARSAPVDDLREAATEPPKLSRGRLLTSAVLAVVGLASSMTPLFVPGLAGTAGAGGAALLLIIAAGLAGPWLVERALGLLGSLLRRGSRASLVLADASARGFPRRMSAAVVPLALGISFAAVQVFVPTTVAAEAGRQSADGVTADYLVSHPASGISPQLTERVEELPGVGSINPVTRSTVLVSRPFVDGDVIVERFAVQGVDPSTVGDTLDLDVGEGSLSQLSAPDTVAISTDAAASIGVDLGERFTFNLGDGAESTATVVAIYSRGLGFGDLTLADDALRPHTTSTFSDQLLVTAEPGQQAQVAEQVRQLGLDVVDSGSLGAAGADQRNSDAWVSLLALAVLLGYMALSIVNTLVMGTIGRRREFALLRLLGASTRQVQRMTLVESLLVGVIAVVVGTAIAIPPLVGIALGVSGLPLPSVPPLIYLGIVATSVTLGVLSIALPTRLALRAPVKP
jgi:putative ABC transport system permease protein